MAFGHSQGNTPASRYRQINAGWSHICGLKRYGSVECWDLNENGQAEDQEGPYAQIIGPPVGVDDNYRTGIANH